MKKIIFAALALATLSGCTSTYKGCNAVGNSTYLQNSLSFNGNGMASVNQFPSGIKWHWVCDDGRDFWH